MNIYSKEENPSVTQGGIISEFRIPFTGKEENLELPQEILVQYAVIISQACDIEQSIAAKKNDNNWLPNIIILPMYVLETFQTGSHLQESYSILQRTFTGKEIEKLQQNHSELRYHFFQKDDKLIPYDTIIDFKHYYTIPKKLIIDQYPEKYIATINPLHKSLLTQRFCNYLSRIALPSNSPELLSA